MTRSAKDYLEREKQKMLEEARTITRKAEDANRSLTDEEKDAVAKKIDEAGLVKTRIKEIEDNEKLDTQIDELDGQMENAGAKTDGGVQVKSIGEAFVKSERFAALKQRGFSGNWSTGPIDIDAKAFGDVPGGTVVSLADTGAAGSYLQPFVIPGIKGPVEQELTIADLFGQGTTDSSTIKYLVEKTHTNAADTVKEGAEKPASYLDFAAATESVKKIATFMPVSDEFLEDESGAASYINGRLTLFVRQTEEYQLLNGTGTDPDISGIFDRTISSAAASDIGGDNLFDAVLAGMTEVRVAGGLQADAVVVNPTDSAKMKVTKADTSGNYMGPGPYAAAGANPWGLREVVTTAVPEGTVLVGAFRAGATLYRRGGLTLTASNSHADWFRKNLTAIRVEERIALAVYRPLAFCTVTLGS